CRRSSRRARRLAPRSRAARTRSRQRGRTPPPRRRSRHRSAGAFVTPSRREGGTNMPWGMKGKPVGRKQERERRRGIGSLTRREEGGTTKAVGDEGQAGRSQAVVRRPAPTQGRGVTQAWEEVAMPFAMRGKPGARRK